MPYIYSQEKIFYVYLYLREKDSNHGLKDSPYYVGKGHGKRAFGSHGNIAIPKDKSRIEIICDELTEEAAFLLEMLLIHFYGRIDLGTGMLQNRTDGGDGVKNRSPEGLARWHASKQANGSYTRMVESIKKGLKTKRKNNTLNSNTPESIEKAIATRTKNNTLNTTTTESLTQMVSTRRKNNSYARSEESRQLQKDTWVEKRKSGYKRSPRSDEHTARIVSTRKATGSYQRSQESIDRQQETKRINGTGRHSPESYAQGAATRRANNNPSKPRKPRTAESYIQGAATRRANRAAKETALRADKISS